MSEEQNKPAEAEVDTTETNGQTAEGVQAAGDAGERVAKLTRR